MRKTPLSSAEKVDLLIQMLTARKKVIIDAINTGKAWRFSITNHKETSALFIEILQQETKA